MKTIFVYLYPEMADFEVVIALHRLRNAGGFEIVTISESLDKVQSQSGLWYVPDRRIADARADDAAGLIIPGGPINNEQNAILPLIREMDSQGKLLAAICFGPQFLGRAGVLDRHGYTTSCTEESILQMGAADPFPRQNFRPGRVVRDGHVITAQGHAPVDFAAQICRYFSVYKDAEQEYSQLFNICDTEERNLHA
ncbi:MAG: DJ-1/PfpI family protein [Clostridia bacterium]|nr:DJ-1/PfpI family protein [Clostridia bacterium]